MSKPNKLDIIWASNASSGALVDPGDTKFELGWEAEIPPYQYFNYVMNKTSAMLDHINTYGIPEWDSLTTYTIGSRVIYIGNLYKCKINNCLGVNPPGSAWDKIDFDQQLNTIDDVQFNNLQANSIYTDNVRLKHRLITGTTNSASILDASHGIDANDIICMNGMYQTVTGNWVNTSHNGTTGGSNYIINASTFGYVFSPASGAGSYNRPCRVLITYMVLS